jgi:hypothetical protein
MQYWLIESRNHEEEFLRSSQNRLAVFTKYHYHVLFTLASKQGVWTSRHVSPYYRKYPALEWM